MLNFQTDLRATQSVQPERSGNKTMTVSALNAQGIESIGNEIYDA